MYDAMTCCLIVMCIKYYPWIVSEELQTLKPLKCFCLVTEHDFGKFLYKGRGHKKWQNPSHCIQSKCTNNSAYTTNTAYLIFCNWEFSLNRHELVVISEIRNTVTLFIVQLYWLPVRQSKSVGEFYITNICRKLRVCVKE